MKLINGAFTFLYIQSVIPLWKELEYYKEYQKKLKAQVGENKSNEIIKEALYMISLGTNDFLENYYAIPGGRSSQYSIGQYQDFLVQIAGNFVKQLYELGGRKISLGGIPPMGCMPLERTTNLMQGRGCVEEYNNVASEFNVKLKNLAEKMNKELPDIQLVFSNPYNVLLQIIRKPSAYGKLISTYINII